MGNLSVESCYRSHLKAREMEVERGTQKLLLKDRTEWSTQNSLFYDSLNIHILLLSSLFL